MRHRLARFMLLHTAVLSLCLAIICSVCGGLTQGEVVVMRALEHLGKPYALGEIGPERFDCSGLVMYCLAPEGYSFELHSAEKIGTDERFRLIRKPCELLAGDVVCFDTIRDRDPSDHMGFYIGGNRFVHASSKGKVMISSLEDYYLDRFTGARRYVSVYTGLPAWRGLLGMLSTQSKP